MKLVILGNGFDLHHGYKTSFSDFRNHLLNSKDENDKKLISDVDIILKSKNVNFEEGILWNDFERIIGQIMKSESNIKIEEIELLSLVEDFTERFYIYLKKEMINKQIVKNKKISNEIEGAASILTFNYTNSYNSYLKDSSTDIFHIHGNLSEDNLPIIGYYYNITYDSNHTDYLLRYHNRAFHKPALAYKQNETNLDIKIIDYKKKWSNQISEIVFIGYSFGESDSHIYNILNKILMYQSQYENILSSDFEKMPIIKFKFFNYNTDETKKLIKKVKENIFSKTKRRNFVFITGNGHIKRQKKEIIKFEITNYN